MTSFAYFTGVTTGTQSLAAEETGYLGVNAVLDGSIIALGDSIDIRVHGTIISSSPSVLSGNNTTLYIGRTGLIDVLSSTTDSAAGFDFIGTGRVLNEGQLRGNVMGLYVGTNVSGQQVYVQNSGTIMGERAGALAHTGTVVLNNSGLIEGLEYGWTALAGVFSGLSAVHQVTNFGVIRGQSFALLSGDAGDTITNRGLLDGNVSTLSGHDVLDNRGGNITGAINLGDGDDTLFLGASVEVANGGAGLKDAIDVTTGAGGVIDLTDEGRGTGLALGDTLLGFERVYGSKSGVDTVYGNTASNLIYTYGGNDVIFADLGADAIYAGRGADTITGGAGNDTFGYQFINEFGDTITDFSSTGSGNDDRFTFRASNLGGGLVAGPLDPTKFQARADNVADANDRFIFRTTDTTLWFDVDGAGGVAPVMVADLQAGATVTAADIILV